MSEQHNTGPGRHPPMMHRQLPPEGRGQRAAGSGLGRSQNADAASRTKGAGTGAGAGGKSNLAGQIIPVYGFGILLYILYILFKVQSPDEKSQTERNPKPHACSCLFLPLYFIDHIQGGRQACRGPLRFRPLGEHEEEDQ